MTFYNMNMKNNIYLGALLPGSWKGDQIANIYSPEIIPLAGKLNLKDEDGNNLSIEIDYCPEGESAFREVVLFIPYWIINHTGLKFVSIDMKKKKPAAGQSK